MARRDRPQRKPSSPQKGGRGLAMGMHAKMVDSLYDAIEEGNEYGSIVSVMPKPGIELLEEIIKGIRVIEAIRSRPCLAYVGDVIRHGESNAGIVALDDLPCAEVAEVAG